MEAEVSVKYDNNNMIGLSNITQTSLTLDVSSDLMLQITFLNSDCSKIYRIVKEQPPLDCKTLKHGVDRPQEEAII